MRADARSGPKKAGRRSVRSATAFASSRIWDAECLRATEEGITMQISESEFRRRVSDLERLMGRDGFDALIAYGSRVQYGTVRYLTGYEPWLTPEEWAFAVLAPGHGAELSLLSNSPWDFWDFNKRESTWVADVVVGSRWVEGIAPRLPATARRVGIVGWYGFPAPVLEGLKERFGRAEFLDATGLVRELREIKSDAEVAL